MLPAKRPQRVEGDVLDPAPPTLLLASRAPDNDARELLDTRAARPHRKTAPRSHVPRESRYDRLGEGQPRGVLIFTRRLFVTAVAVATAGCLLGAATVHAATTTQWFTIDVRPPTAASPDLFLAVHSRFDDSPVELTHYQSETPPVPGQYSSWANQQWTPVLSDYPASPDVTGSGPITDVLSALYGAFTCGPSSDPAAANPLPACGFNRSLLPPVLKFVNRGSGRCLSVFNWTRNGQGTTVVASRCRRSQPRQIWNTSELAAARLNDPAGDYGDLWQKRSQNPGVRFCMDVGRGNAHDHRRAEGDRLQVWSCTSGNLHGNQEFRFLHVGEATCEPQYAAQVCGLQQDPR